MEVMEGQGGCSLARWFLSVGGRSLARYLRSVSLVRWEDGYRPVISHPSSSIIHHPHAAMPLACRFPLPNSCTCPLLQPCVASVYASNR